MNDQAWAFLPGQFRFRELDQVWCPMDTVAFQLEKTFSMQKKTFALAIFYLEII